MVIIYFNKESKFLTANVSIANNFAETNNQQIDQMFETKNIDRYPIENIPIYRNIEEIDELNGLSLAHEAYKDDKFTLLTDIAYITILKCINKLPEQFDFDVINSNIQAFVSTNFGADYKLSTKNKVIYSKIYNELKSINVGRIHNLFSKLYEKFLITHKISSDIRYTKNKLIKLINDSGFLTIKNIDNVCDPFCGTGGFLVNLMNKFKINTDNVIGYDNDQVPFVIALLNLYNENLINGKDIMPNLAYINSLSPESHLNKYDFIQTIITASKTQKISLSNIWKSDKDLYKKIFEIDVDGKKSKTSTDYITNCLLSTLYRLSDAPNAAACIGIPNDKIINKEGFNKFVRKNILSRFNIAKILCVPKGIISTTEYYILYINRNEQKDIEYFSVDDKLTTLTRIGHISPKLNDNLSLDYTEYLSYINVNQIDKYLEEDGKYKLSKICTIEKASGIAPGSYRKEKQDDYQYEVISKTKINGYHKEFTNKKIIEKDGQQIQKQFPIIVIKKTQDKIDVKFIKNQVFLDGVLYIKGVNTKVINFRYLYHLLKNADWSIFDNKKKIDVNDLNNFTIKIKYNTKQQLEKINEIMAIEKEIKQYQKHIESKRVQIKEIF